jgi:DNA-binding IclR family transcriptional regulator
MPEISKTADQTLVVLECVADHGPITPTEIARRLKMHRPAVHRSLATLHRRGYVRRVADGYLPGVAALRIAQRVEPALLAAARPVLESLARQHGETFILTIPDGDEAVLAEQAVGGRHFVRVQFARGFRHPLALGASGRAILAWLDDGRAERLAAAARDAAALRRSLAEIRKQGYAVSHDELSTNVYGVSAPVLRRSEAVASLGVVLPAARADDLAALARIMKGAAQSVSRSLAKH